MAAPLMAVLVIRLIWGYVLMDCCRDMLTPVGGCGQYGMWDGPTNLATAWYAVYAIVLSTSQFRSSWAENVPHQSERKYFCIVLPWYRGVT